MEDPLSTVVITGAYAALRIVLDGAISEQTRWRLATTFNIVSSQTSVFEAQERLAIVAQDNFPTPVHFAHTQGCAELGRNVWLSILMEVLVILCVSMACGAKSLKGMNGSGNSNKSVSKAQILLFGLFNPITLLSSVAASCWWMNWALPAVALLVFATIADSKLRNLLVGAVLIVNATLDFSGMAMLASVCLHKEVRKVIARFAIFGAAPVYILFASGAPSAPSTLSPNIGVFWYMLQLNFPAYENFFNYVFQLTPTAVALPLAMKVSFLKPELGSMFVFTVATITSVVCRQQLLLIDILLGLLICYSAFPEVVGNTQYIFVSATTAVIALPLQVAFYNGWIYQQVANANFLFFSCAALMVAGIIFVAQYIVSMLKMQRVEGKKQE